MTDRSASKASNAFGSSKAFIQGAKPTAENGSAWREDVRRSLSARIGGLRDFTRERRWPVLAAVAIVALSGAGVVASVGGATTDRAEALDKTLADKEKRVAALDADRKRHEDRLAALQKQINARESETAEAEERIAALEKRRAGLERQVAELVAPVAGDEPKEAGGAGAPLPEARDREASSANDADMPPDEAGGRAPSTASVDRRASSDLGSRRSPAIERIRAASRDDGPTDTAEFADHSVAASVRVFIHVRSDDPQARERAAAVAAELRRRGVSVAEIRGVLRPVRRDAVRFFYDQDRDAVPELRDALRSASPRGGEPEVRDLRSYGAPPKRGTLEIWLS